jgi:choline dehydrogenase-like flavoprotein
VIHGSIDAYAASGFNPAVCIVGSGPAGLSLAMRLESRHVPCVVLEAGGAAYSAQSQDAYRGTVAGGPYFELHQARLRQFGGSSNHWTGWCRPLDAVDFMPRAGISPTGWPIRRADLEPYTEAAREMLGIGALRPDIAVGADLADIDIKRDPPRRFAIDYKARLEASRSIAVVLNAPAFALKPASGRIERLIVKPADERERAVVAAHYVVCAGGIENSRLLLWSNALYHGGVVPHPETLGKYWMEHPHHTVGRALMLLSNKTRAQGVVFIAPNERFLLKQAVGNFGLRLNVGEELSKALLKDAMCVMPQVVAEMVQHRFGRGFCGPHVDLAWEQPPLASNRIELDPGGKDAGGMPRAVLHWRLGDHERRTALIALQALGSQLVAADQGRVQIAPWLADERPFPTWDEQAGFHHMGGTRMSSGPQDGVVDGHCRVHGMDNLHVGGSSVFHSCGHANPTFTIVQLALRLADRLAQRLAVA